MATNKQKKVVKVRDLKPAKDAKGGFGRMQAPGGGTHGPRPDGPGTHKGPFIPTR
jgi:hypothetical protein